MTASPVLALWFAIALSCAGVAAAPSDAAAPDNASASDRSTSMDTDRSGHFTTKVTLNGQGPFSFIVDTGAQGSSLSRQVSEKLGLQHGLDMTLIGASGSETTKIVTVDNFRNELFERQVESMPLLPNTTGEDGILGMNIFTSGRLEFDFAKRVLLFGPSRPSPAMFAPQQGDVRKNNFMVVDVVVDNVPTKAMIDTGGTGVIGNPQLFAALGFKSGDSRLQPVEPLQDITTQPTQTFAATVGELRLGPIRFVKPQVAFLDLSVFHVLGLDKGPALIIGIDLMSHLDAMAIDYPRAQLQLRP